MGKIFCLLLMILACLFSACTITRPMWGLPGGLEHSVADEVAKQHALKQAIEKLAARVPHQQKIALVQVVHDGDNDQILDDIYEHLFKEGYTITKLDEHQLGQQEGTELYDAYLIVYPIILGVEYQWRRPWPFLSYIPVLGVIAQWGEHKERQAGVSLHARLVDARTGQITWIDNFSGKYVLRPGYEK